MYICFFFFFVLTLASERRRYCQCDHDFKVALRREEKKKKRERVILEIIKKFFLDKKFRTFFSLERYLYAGVHVKQMEFRVTQVDFILCYFGYYYYHAVTRFKF